MTPSDVKVLDTHWWNDIYEVQVLFSSDSSDLINPPTSLGITSNGIICYLLVTDGMLIAVRDVNNPF